MILRALYELAIREQLVNDRDFPLIPVTWLVMVTRDGRISGVTDTRAEMPAGKKTRLVAKSFPVPYQPGRSGTKAPASFFVDNAKYVFGRATADKSFNELEGSEKSGWFRDRIRACADTTADPGAIAVLTSLDSVSSGAQKFVLPATCKSNDLFAFIYEPDVDELVHMRPAVQAYWRKEREIEAERYSGTGAGHFECLVTGAPLSTPGLFPKVKNVPGGQSSGSPLVSFNAAAFTSYGLDANENAPISREAAEGCAAALNRLLHPAFPDPRPEHANETLPRRNLRLGDDTAACYWSNRTSADPFLNAIGLEFEADADQVGDVYRSVWRNREVSAIDASAFYALIVSGSQGRMVVRDWVTTTVSIAVDNVAQHLADLEIVRNTPVPKGGSLPDRLPMRALLGSLAPFGRRDAIPPSLATDIFHAALTGTPYPLSVLQRAIERARAEIGRSDWADLERRDARAALIKGVLTRRRRQGTTSSYPELTVALEPNNASPGYLCGRLMAVIERLQQAALGDVNATVVDRFFGAASATPRAVFTRLLRNARHHARKAKDDPQTAGTARWLEAQLDGIVVHFDVARNDFPAFLDLEQQGLFMLGYHQQRHELWKKREARAESVA